MEEETFPIHVTYGGPVMMTRKSLRGMLDRLVPRGLAYTTHYLHNINMREEDFVAACHHFGLDHLLFDVSIKDILTEVEARRARGARPTCRDLPVVMGEEQREIADASLDVYERRAAYAEEMARARAAMRGTARRPAAGRIRRPLPPLPRADGGKVYTFHPHHGGAIEVTREGLRHLLGLLVPHGLAYIPYRLYEHDLYMSELRSACHSLGLRHLLFDVPVREVLAEVEARRARGARPTGRGLPLAMGEEDREYADAMLDVYERKAAEAERAAALEVAPAAA
ncbi:MAG: hypothetical protein OXU37_03785 [Thaumarchaeota archaeon]|nr:hypothetical protein [Nitrososphaerota archaeon]MDD9813375.1 hypothetical protein [Nitrososphaerota archaeon]RNJ72143.1 MAG: hypothetical protein EB832_04420 [Thaumarchaeota archaeon S14]RNJ73706.1 MAG: hypothetical protein EB833_02270 [Thaumarchaeota archaeon S13]